jgi:hypothetical protein
MCYRALLNRKIADLLLNHRSRSIQDCIPLWGFPPRLITYLLNITPTSGLFFHLKPRSASLPSADYLRSGGYADRSSARHKCRCQTWTLSCCDSMKELKVCCPLQSLRVTIYKPFVSLQMLCASHVIAWSFRVLNLFCSVVWVEHILFVLYQMVVPWGIPETSLPKALTPGTILSWILAPLQSII